MGLRAHPGHGPGPLPLPLPSVGNLLQILRRTALSCLGLCTHSSPSLHPPPFLIPCPSPSRSQERWHLLQEAGLYAHEGSGSPRPPQGPAGWGPCEGAWRGVKGAGIFTSARENLSAWVRRSCLNLEEVGSSGEGLAGAPDPEGENGGSPGPGGHPPKSREGPKVQVATLTRRPSALPASIQHGAPGTRPAASTYSSLFTTPLPLGSNRRKALRMASSGSVPGRPRGPGKQPHCHPPGPTQEEPRVQGESSSPREARGCSDRKCPLGLRGTRIGCPSEMGEPGRETRIGDLGLESEGIFPNPETWGAQCSWVWNAEVAPTTSGWDSGRVQAGSRWGSSSLPGQGDPEPPQAHR